MTPARPVPPAFDDLPPSAPAHPSRLLLHTVRPLARTIIRTRYRVAGHGVHHVPRTGPVILASNHIGIIDGPLLAIFAPRPVHALTKVEMFSGALGRFLRAAGQVPLDRFHPDPGAVRSCLRVLRDGGVVGVFPEGRRGDGELGRFHHGATYLAMVSGAPVVPVTIIGTREPGGHADSLPPRGASLELVFGEPWRIGARPWPRRAHDVRSCSAALLAHLVAQQHRALTDTGRALPGPLPEGESDPDPDTGFIEPDEQTGTA